MSGSLECARTKIKRHYEDTMARDDKGRFVKGETPEGAIPINEGIAKEYQARSVASRREHKTIADQLRNYLDQDAGNGYTRGEILVMQAVKNHKDGRLTFRDLCDLSRILGEDTLNINTNGPQMIVVSAAAIQSASKWSKKKDEE